ncbi:DUF3693 domain-containing protein [Stenotrophomonas maltophilia]|nr:DUF3693 domain-containing protein [Stenotrophomonas maltophilia]
MDWADFFEKTRVAAGAESFAKLAPKIGVTDGAISHYRVGRSVPQVWVVADCLRIQGHPTPEKAAVEIMRAEARTSTERTFWKRLAATAMALCLAVGFALPHKAQAAVPGFDNGHVVYIMRNHDSVKSGSLLALPDLPTHELTATTETPQIPQLSARISPQGRPRFPDLPQRCP